MSTLPVQGLPEAGEHWGDEVRMLWRAEPPGPGLDTHRPRPAPCSSLDPSSSAPCTPRLDVSQTAVGGRAPGGGRCGPRSPDVPAGLLAPVPPRLTSNASVTPLRELGPPHCSLLGSRPGPERQHSVTVRHSYPKATNASCEGGGDTEASGERFCPPLDGSLDAHPSRPGARPGRTGCDTASRPLTVTAQPVPWSRKVLTSPRSRRGRGAGEGSCLNQQRGLGPSGLEARPPLERRTSSPQGRRHRQPRGADGTPVCRRGNWGSECTRRQVGARAQPGGTSPQGLPWLVPSPPPAAHWPAPTHPAVRA